ncbi:hypothetical protein Cgig2_006329 [Carnegiea gigantea]|uniref:Uncharacterized protein n=1 Tax=Carnegiea gigantea TaxID=171969 RepID=A0A9Q1Q870_9CARY|nr:hypothetical protein Cgig2_006329 [Carnegiea gigantea]
MLSNDLVHPRTKWFKSLTSCSISNFSQLVKQFTSHFMNNRRREKNSNKLMNMCRGPNETLRLSIRCFNVETILIPKLKQNVARFAYKENANTLGEALSKADKFIRIDEINKTAEQISGGAPEGETTPYLWCDLHSDYGHSSTECRDLKDNLEDLMRRGYCSQFKATSQREVAHNQDHNFPGGTEPNGGDNKKGTINAHLKGLSNEVIWTKHGPTCLNTTGLSMTFIDDDLMSVCLPHDDPLVVTLNLGGYDVARILVDEGSAVHIIFERAFKQMGILEGSLKSVDYPIIGHPIKPEGLIRLSILIEEEESSRHLKPDFLVVDLTSTYNVIIGRTLHQAGAVVTTYHLTMLYVSDQGITGRLRGNKHIARECYINPDTSRREANGLNPKRTRCVVECDHVGMVTLDAREEFIPTTKLNENPY